MPRFVYFPINNGDARGFVKNVSFENVLVIPNADEDVETPEMTVVDFFNDPDSLNLISAELSQVPLLLHSSSTDLHS